MKRLLIALLFVLTCSTGWGQVRDMGNGIILAAGREIVVASVTATVSYSNSTWTADLDLVEDKDENLEFNTTTGKFTAARKKTVLVVYRNRIDETTPGTNIISSVLKNSSPGTADINTFLKSYGINFIAGTNSAYSNLVQPVSLDAGEYFYIANYVNDSSARNRIWAHLRIFEMP